MRLFLVDFLIFQYLIVHCYGMSKHFFGSESDDNCSKVENELKTCSEELAELRATGQCREPRIVPQRSVCDTYMKRFLNLLLTSVSLKNRHLIDGERVSVMVSLTFTSESLTILKSFSRDFPHGYSWVNLDDSLVTLLEGVTSGQIETTESNDSPDVNMEPAPPTNPIVVIVAVVGSLVVIILYLVLIDQSLVRTMFVGCVLVFALCFGWTWHLEVREETHRGLMSLRQNTIVPDYCFNTNQGWWAQLWEAITGYKEHECKKYHEALMYEPWTRVSIVKVLTKTLSGLLLESLPLLGKKLGQMITNFNRELGFIPTVFGGLTSALLIPPLLLFSVAFFFSNVFSSTIASLLTRPSMPHSQRPPLPQPPAVSTTSDVTTKPAIGSEQTDHFRILNRKFRKKTSSKFRPKIKLLQSISSPACSAEVATNSNV